MNNRRVLRTILYGFIPNLTHVRKVGKMDVATNIGTGFAIGLATMLIVTIIGFPISFVMNRYIYHNWVMRLLMGFLTMCFPFISFFIAFYMGWDRKACYFGLFPLIEAPKSPPIQTGWFAFLFMAFRALLHPLSMFFDDEKYNKSLSHLLVAEGDTNFLNEVLVSKALEAGAEKDIELWESKLKLANSPPSEQTS